MQPLKKKIGELEKEIEQAKKALKFSDLEQKLAELDDQLNQPEIWNNPDYAQELTKQAASLRQTVEPWQTLTVQVSDMVELMDLGADDLLPEFQLRRVLIAIKLICYSLANMIIARQLCVFLLELADWTLRILRRCWSECICAGRKNLE